MFEPPSSLAAFSQVVALVSTTKTAALFSAVGLILTFFALGALVKLMGTGDPATTPRWQKVVAGLSLTAGLVFMVAGPSIALLENSQTKIKLVPKSIALDRLENNERVDWLIRMVPYYPNRQPELAASKLLRLGPEKVKYVFVGSYQELKGRTVESAIAMIGGAYQRGQHVAAVIFTRSGEYPIVPANARGLLQVIQRIEAGVGADIEKPFLKAGRLNEVELANLESDQIHSYRFASYRGHYQRFCQLAHAFRCQKRAFDVSGLISEINADWHPAGAAVTPAVDPCDNSPTYCTHEAWPALRSALEPTFGARVFLMENKPIPDLRNRYLIDFENPAQQLIPEIGDAEVSP
ncbi:hypothetical protein [Methylopila turkensis]|uniref:Uncharacterized protein n=1 Tax=Methylopila turkensis TaxID=1437816 RepID=A0A9W6N7F3_9HYPH|nr:hypothetical protein [Methylopila turkensis]GLK80352.1 hypothetical protein GCM10008174_20930 [Methylopila turkensis]